MSSIDGPSVDRWAVDQNQSSIISQRHPASSSMNTSLVLSRRIRARALLTRRRATAEDLSWGAVNRASAGWFRRSPGLKPWLMDIPRRLICTSLLRSTWVKSTLERKCTDPCFSRPITRLLTARSSSSSILLRTSTGGEQ